MSGEIQTIQQLAELDGRIHQLNLRLKRIPGELSEARRQLEAEEGLFEEVNGPYTELERQNREKEETIKVALETIEKFEEHMTRVTTQKEYMAAKKQVEEARKLNEQLQEEILQNNTKQEELQPSLSERRERYEAVRGDFEQQESRILGEQAELERELAEYKQQVEALAETLGERTYQYYERLQRGNLVPAIVPVRGGSCTGCNMALPPQIYNQLVAQNGEFFTCPSCRRMVFLEPQPEAEEAEQEEGQQATGEGEKAAASAS